jgi:hypothetical protein
MRRTDGAYGDDLTANKFEPVASLEDAGVRHAVVIVDREK